jgi:hypothetical protein
MDTSQGFLLTVGWVFLRFGVPVLITSLIILFLSQIDSNWKSEALSKRKEEIKKSVIPMMKCWVFNDCPPEKRTSCLAYNEKYLPCWQVFRENNGNLKDGCLDCPVFRNAPIPIIDSY